MINFDNSFFLIKAVLIIVRAKVSIKIMNLHKKSQMKF